MSELETSKDWTPIAVLMDCAEDLGISVATFRSELHEKLSFHNNIHDELTLLEVYSYYDRNLVDAIRSAIYKMAGHVPITLAQYEIMFHYMLGADNLHGAIKRIWEFSSVAQQSLESARMELTRKMGEASLSINWGVGDLEKQYSSFFYSEFYRTIYIFEWLIGCPLGIHKIDVPFSKNDYSEKLNKYLNYPISYDKAAYTMHFSERTLDRPIVRNIGDLKFLLKVYPAVSVLQSGMERLSIRVEHFMISQCISSEKMLSAPQLATLLNMSETSMRRKLKSEGTSYGEIRRRCQESVARYLLKSTSQDISCIGYGVGFESAAAFRRAFKSWTGMTPSEARGQF